MSDCEGCKWYRQDPALTVMQVMKCMKYQNAYCTRCDQYDDGTKTEPVPVDNSQEFIDFVPDREMLPKTPPPPPPTEDRDAIIARLQEELDRLKSGG